MPDFPGEYTVEFRGLYFYEGCYAYSPILSATVGDAPAITSSGGGAICPGNNLTLSSSTSGGAGCSYQWQISSNGSGGPWTNITNATDSTYNTGALTATRWYRVQRICTGGGCDDPISNVQEVTLANPTITLGSDQNICQGTGLTLNLSSALGGATALSYQWEKASSVSGPWTNINGATGTSYNTGPPSMPPPITGCWVRQREPRA